LFERIIELATEKKIFLRNKKSMEIKILAAVIYYFGLSYRKVSKGLSFIEKFSTKQQEIGTSDSRNCFPAKRGTGER
jgi:hypothetical protein